jgi:molecular chaperone Hsp33
MRDIPYDIFDTISVGYKCDCGRERMLKKIRSLGKSEIVKMLDEQAAEGKERELSAICRFCNTSYTFDEKALLG